MNRSSFWSRWPCPTARFGWTAAGTLFLVAAGAETGRNPFLLLGGIGFGVVVAAFVACAWNLRGLRVERSVPHPIHAGASFVTTLTICNCKAFLPACLVLLEESVRGTGLPAGQLLGGVAGLAARRSATVRLAGKFFRRGEKRFDGVRLWSSFPLGLFRVARFVALEEAIVVYPRLRVVSRRALPEETPQHGLDAAAARARLGLEFTGLHEFRPGDNPRWIHWRTSAKLDDRLLVREFESAANRQVRILFDPYVPPGTLRRDGVLDRAVSFVASLAAELVRRGYGIDVRILGPEGRSFRIEPRGRSLYALYHALALLPPADQPSEPARSPRGVPQIVVESERLRPGVSAERAFAWR